MLDCANNALHDQFIWISSDRVPHADIKLLYDSH